MSILNLIFVLSSFIGASEQNTTAWFTNSCELKASIKSEDHGQYFSVEVSVENNTSAVEYYFFESKSRTLINEDEKSNEMRISKKGDYFCIVIQNDQCHVKTDFKL